MKIHSIFTKLLTISFLMLFSFNFLNAQINYSTNFNNNGTMLPSSWVGVNYNVTSTDACEGSSVMHRLRNTSNSYLITPNFSGSNGQPITITFDYKIINFTGGAATGNNFGSIQIQYSINDGTSFTTFATISTDHVPSTSCKPAQFTLPSGTIPIGTNVRIKILNTWSTGDFKIIYDNFRITQDTSTPPSCNANLTSPANGAQNVPVSTNQISWSNATGVPSGYKLTIGTTQNGSEIYNNIDVGNVNSYPIGLIYNTTYYVKIVPYNANGTATGCITRSFTTEAPITTSKPWNEGFPTNNVVPTGWTNNGFVIATQSRLPDSDGNIIFKNLNASQTTSSFSTINVGLVSSGDVLTFNYRLAGFNSPYAPPIANSGNFKIAVSTDYGINFTEIQTINNDGVAGWREHLVDLSAYVNNYVKIKITVNRTSENYFIGFDDFYIGSTISCVKPENLKLNYTSDTEANFTWNANPNASNYNWLLFYAGQNPATATPIQSGSSNTNSKTISNLNPSTNYSFYVQNNCGLANGVSYLSDPITFSTQCQLITEFPFVETFETNSLTSACWQMEYVSGTQNWTFQKGNGQGGAVTTAHSGNRNALFYFLSLATHTTKMVSPSYDLSGISNPKLSFWYTNQVGDNISEINELKVYYKTSVNGTWNLIPNASYNTNVTNWTKIELNLPNPSSQYYIAFEGKNRFGYGITIDDVSVFDGSGCTETTIWDGLTWSNGLPDASKKTIINGNLNLFADLVTCDLVVNNTGNLTIKDGGSITVNGQIINHNVASNFTVEDGANLIQTQLANNKINQGSISVKQLSQPFKRLDYTMWSSPVSSQNILAFSPETIPNRIYTYEGANMYQIVPNPESNNFISGKGYLFRAPNDWSSTTPTAYLGEFNGVPNNGNIQISTHPNSFTSIGNPYPSTINADSFIAGNSGVSTLYFWTNTNPPNAQGNYVANNYVSYNVFGGSGINGNPNIPDGKVSVGQGFIVSSTNSTAQFNNAMRENSEALFYRNETNNNTETYENLNAIERHRIWINIGNSSDPNNYYNQNLIGYMTGATNGYDPQLDAVMFGYDGTALFSIIEGREDLFVIQARALPFDINDAIPMGIRINTVGDFRIEVQNFDGMFAQGQQIYIHDKYLDIIHNLNEDDYHFHSEIGIFKDRFDIVFQEAQDICDSFTIWNGSTWSNGLPNIAKKAIIDGDFTLSTDLEVCQIEVTTNGNFQVLDGVSLTIENNIINQNEAENFFVAFGANIFQNQNMANQGEITVQRLSKPMLRLDYTMWSSPVANQGLQAFSPETLANRIYTYEANGYVSVFANDDAPDQNFSNNRGYLFRSPNNWSSTIETPYEGLFKGLPNNGPIQVNGVTQNGFYSLGNPYPSNIDADILLVNNPNIAAIFFWTNANRPVDGQYDSSTNNYAYYNLSGNANAENSANQPNGIISVGQGFIVRSGNATATVNFDNSLRTDESATSFRTSSHEKNRLWLDLFNESDVKLNQILVGYIEGATDGFDHQYDAEIFGYEGTAIYSILDDAQLIIQGKATPFETSDIVPLGLNIIEAGQFRIALHKVDGLFLEGQTPVLLKDKALNIVHDLTVSDYTFDISAGIINDRFEIIYQSEGEMNVHDLTQNAVLIYQNNNHIVLDAKAKKLTSVELFDLQGRQIHHNAKVNASTYQIEVASFGPQVFVVKATTADGKLINKKIIKN